MKRTKAVISILLSSLMLFTAMLPAGAVAVEAEETTIAAVEEKKEASSAKATTNKALEKEWKDAEEAKRGITVNPGRTESERNFSWYMSADVTECRVEISKKKNISPTFLKP